MVMQQIFFSGEIFLTVLHGAAEVPLALMNSLLLGMEYYFRFPQRRKKTKTIWNLMESHLVPLKSSFVLCAETAFSAVDSFLVINQIYIKYIYDKLILMIHETHDFQQTWWT